MPTFFVIGAAKCGTTSLHSYLDLHPEISMSSSKEPAFFVPEPIYRTQVTERKAYLSLFESGARHLSWGVISPLHDVADPERGSRADPRGDSRGEVRLPGPRPDRKGPFATPPA